MSRSLRRLADDVVAEPLINQWYAWSYLIPPASAARYLSESQLAVMASFVAAPEVHVAALRDPAMRGGPFIAYGTERAAELRELLQRTRREQRELIALSSAIAALERLLAAHPRGDSMDVLYAQLPAALRGYVELVCDGRHQPAARYHEGLLYRSGYWRPGNQSLALRRLADSDRRAFVMSTPRLQADVQVSLQRPFADPALDALFAARSTPTDVPALAERLGLAGVAAAAFETLFSDAPLRGPPAWSGPGLRVRYFGHACVLVETPTTTILVDPLVSPEHPQGLARYSLADLPPRIDYALITHNHQDHVMFETLLQLRPRIGCVLVPAGQRGSLLDPSLRLILQRIGFAEVRELDRLDETGFDGGRILSLPVLGEHGDLDIASKTAWWIEAGGRSLLCAADSNNLDPVLYEHVARCCGPLDLLFIGMECEGAPFTWAYGPLLPQPVPHAQAQARRLNGSDAKRAMALIERLKPAQVCVYAMGMEPWLEYITSIHYTPQSAPILESDALIAQCRARGIAAKRCYGRAEFLLAPGMRAPQATTPLPAVAGVAVAVMAVAVPAAAEVAVQVVAEAEVAPMPAGDAAPPPLRGAPQAASAAAEDTLGPLLDALHAKQVQLQLRGGQLQLSAPMGALTLALTAQLKAHKPALLALLGGPAAQAAAALLPDDAQLPAAWSRFASAEHAAPRHILMSGATGFVGSQLLHALLTQTEARISCLLRTANAADGLVRLQQALAAIGRWQPGFAARLQPLPGDLAQPRWGLADADWQHLADSVDTVWHNGASVHHLLPYEQLRAANVGGTLSALAFAAEGRAKRLHHVSSLSVLPPITQAAGRRFLESDPLPAAPQPAGGYNRSKWVAEQLVRAAMARGLAATIYRPGPVSGDSTSGAFNRNDFLLRLLSGYLQSGIAPAGELPLDLLPVDWLARALVHAGAQPGARGATLHLLHPRPASSQALFEACADAGHALRRVPYADWYRDLQRIAREAPEHPLYPLVALFGARELEGVPPGHELEGAPAVRTLATPYDTRVAQALLADAPFVLPALDRRLFATYLHAMRGAGLLSDEVAV